MRYKASQKSLLVKQEIRDTGLEVVGPLPWGTHFCQFYQTQKDLTDILVPYFKAGLENNELCVWVTSEFLTKEEAITALKKDIPNFSKYYKKGQIEIFPHTEWYLKGGIFEMKRVLKDWVDKHDNALQKGFDGTRVSGNPFWIDNKKDWDDFAEYEAQINKVIDPYKLLVLCTYSLEKCHANEVIDVVTNHEFALIKRAGKWELIESAEQKKAKEALRVSEEKYKSLFDNLINGFAYCKMIFDKKGKPIDFIYLEINDSFERLTGLKRENVIGKNVTKAIPGTEKANPELFKIYGRVALTQKEEKFEIFFKPLSKWLSISVYCPKIGYFVAVFDDITDRKTIEERQRNLFTIVGHEIKNLITPIVLSSSILRKTYKGDSNLKNALDLIEHQTKNMSNLVKDLLDISRIERGKIELYRKKIDLSPTIKNVVETLKPAILNAKQKIELSLPEEKIIISADSLRLEQILTNILTNASKYSKEKGIIKIKLKQVEKEAFIIIKDNGIGISKESLWGIFDLFVQVHQSGTQRKEGLGIGLYLSRELARLHGGDIYATSKGLGEGSEFTIKLPLKKNLYK